MRIKSLSTITTTILLISIVQLTACHKEHSNLEDPLPAAKEVVEFEFGAGRIAKFTMQSLDEMIKKGTLQPSERKIYKEWATSTFSDPEFINELAKIKMRRYTPSELKIISKFYKTEAGRKLLNDEFELGEQYRAINRANTEKHMPDLLKRLGISRNTSKQK